MDLGKADPSLPVRRGGANCLPPWSSSFGSSVGFEEGQVRMKALIRTACVAGIGVGALLFAAPSAEALPAVRTVCVGNDLYIFTSDGGTGVIYNSTRC